jgi:hypothetical protein
MRNKSMIAIENPRHKHHGLMAEDCITNTGHGVCEGCSCLCHWDPVLVEHFAGLGRKQNWNKIESSLRSNSYVRLDWLFKYLCQRNLIDPLSKP